jgi:hypothetical protein
MSVPGLSDSLLASLGAVRKAYPVIQYQGIDVSQTFIPSLTSLTFKEGFGDQQLADVLDITLADPEALFRRSWSLSTGQTVSASIVIENWSGPGTGTLTKPLGLMYIKSVRIDQSKGSGTTVKLSCSSIDPATAFRLEKKTRAWTQTTVRDVVNQVATDNALKPQYQPAANPAMERVDQHDHSDAVMLRKLTSENDFAAKIKDGQLWIRDRVAVEQSAPVGTIICPSPQTGPGGLNGSGIESWNFSEITEDANYTEADLKYKDNTTGSTVSGTAKDPNQTGPGPKLVYHADPHTGAPRSTEGITLN